MAYVQTGGKKEDSTDEFKSNAFKLEHIPFGEVADAPPQVSLKRKNHVNESGSASRHSLALQKHLQAGQAKLLKAAEVCSIDGLLQHLLSKHSCYE
jgi:hypothetical protein